jgi:hypothetical protein
MVDSKIMFISIWVLLAGCAKSPNGNGNTEQNFVQHQDCFYENLIEVDVTKNYQKKEILIEDIANIEYVSLETNDDFLCDGRIDIVATTGKYIIVNNRRSNTILIYDRKGKALKKIDRKGGSGEEYSSTYIVVFDEKNEELYIYDILRRKISVYSLDGKYMRGFHQQSDVQYSAMAIFNDTILICYDGYIKKGKSKIPFELISKQTGEKKQDIRIPFEERLSIDYKIYDETSSIETVAGIPTFPILSYKNSFILTELSCDTVFMFTDTKNLIPVLVRTPSIQKMNVQCFIIPNLITNRYFFMWSVKKEWNWDTQTGFPSVALMYDALDKKIYECNLKCNHFEPFPRIHRNSNTDENVYVATIESFKVKENEADLTGELRQIASTLTDDDNPVLMIMKFK